MLFRVRSTTNTPGALVESLTEAEHSAIAEAHTPHEGRIFRMRRPRPIVGRLDSSVRDGRRQPFRPPTALLAQVKRTFAEDTAVVWGDFSQTKPVSLSNTASPLKAWRMTNRCDAGSTWSHRSA